MKSACLVALTLLADAAWGVDHKVVPTGYETVTGTGVFNGPLSLSAQTYQWLIHADQLAPLVGRTLNGLSLRLGPSTATFPSSEVVIPSVDLSIGVGVSPNLRSIANFSANHIGPLTLVRSGPLTIAPGSYPYGGIDFGTTIAFSDYIYNGGHLLIELRKGSHTGNATSLSAIVASGGATLGYGSQFSACWGGSSTSTSGAQGNFIIAKIQADPLPTFPVTGNIAFMDYTGALEGKVVSMVLLNAGSTTVVHSASVTVNSAGDYTFLVPQTLPLASYDLIADASPFLRRKQSLILTGSGASDINFALPNGDSNDSGEVDPIDIDLVVAAFGSSVGSADYSLSRDMNGSGEVDPIDIDIVISNFGQRDD